MPHREERSVLSRVGQGLVAFGAGTTSSNIDTIRANRDLAQSQAELGQQQVTAGQTAAQRDLDIQNLIGIAMSDRPDKDQALTRLFQISPEIGDQIFEGIGARSTFQREDAARRAAEIQSASPERRPQIIQRQAEELRAQGRDPSDTESLLTMTPQEQDNVLRFTQAAALSTQQRAEGAEAVLERGFEERRVTATERGVELREDELIAARGLAESTRLNQQVEANLKTEEGLRKELNTLLKDFFQVADANARVNAAGTNPSAAGDLALIFNYMKLLDPGSTVREGEFATAQNSASVPQRVRGLYNSITEGQRLSEPQRADFLDRAGSLFEAAQGEAQKTANAFERIATNAEVNVGNVLASFQERRQDINGGSRQTTAPATAIAFLRANDTPENRAQFVQKFGSLPEGF